jgi:gliding motility-associated-like protein
LVYSKPDTSLLLFINANEGACSARDSIYVQVHPEVRADFTQSQSNLCQPDTVVFLNLSANSISYQWYFGDSSAINNTTNPKYFYHSFGTYTTMLISIGDGGCRDTAYGKIPIQIQPILSAEVISDPGFPVELILPAGSLSLKEISGQLSHWHWDFGDGTQYQGVAQVNHTYQNPGTYYLTLRAQDSNACPVHWKAGPVVIRPPELFIPNVFSPNGDGIGDYFRIEYVGNEHYHLQIIDRWGVTQFDTHNPQQPWDGRDLNGSAVSEGVYFYVVTIGQTPFQGNITVVR